MGWAGLAQWVVIFYISPNWDAREVSVFDTASLETTYHRPLLWGGGWREGHPLHTSFLPVFQILYKYLIHKAFLNCHSYCWVLQERSPDALQGMFPSCRQQTCRVLAHTDTKCALWVRREQRGALHKDVLITHSSVCRINLSICSDTKAGGVMHVFGGCRYSIKTAFTPLSPL